MDRDYWRRSIRKWFKPYKYDNSNRKKPESTEEEAAEYYGGVEKDGTYKKEGDLRGIRVWVASRHLKGDVDEAPLHSFYGNILAIGDDDNLDLFDSTRAPTLIPWFTVRFIEVN